mmetsp:Transcript_7994/g.20044  ORF Transcript_7994/g.20044 Transcript_7994/m.20044 type:complete len:104 (-) Transcript_7994:1863-2174(-)
MQNIAPWLFCKLKVQRKIVHQLSSFRERRRKTRKRPEPRRSLDRRPDCREERRRLREFWADPSVEFEIGAPPKDDRFPSLLREEGEGVNPLSVFGSIGAGFSE